jgi:amidase
MISSMSTNRSHVVDRSRLHALFDRAQPPALTIDSGDEVTFETLDACWGEVRSIADFERYRADKSRISNPLTGPVFVRGAKAGGTLVVDIVGIELHPLGFQLIGPNRGIVRDEVKDWECQVVRVEGDHLHLASGITLPIAPVIGQLGNAPAGSATNKPGRTGGNLDAPPIGIGARVYFPIEVDGAIFSLGDVHARQGDGELAGAPEIGARVTVRLSVKDQTVAAWPLVERDGRIYIIASAATEAEAIRLASIELAGLLMRAHDGMRFANAMILLTLCAEIRCMRTGTWGDHGPVIAVSVSKSLLDQNSTARSKLGQPPMTQEI